MMMRPDESETTWQTADKGEVFSRVFAQVREIETRQSAMYQRFVKLEALYDPNNPIVSGYYMRDASLGTITENLIAQNVDTVYAAIATTDIEARVKTDGADWSTQRRAIDLEHYMNQLKAKFDVLPCVRTAFREGAKKGTGFVFVGADVWNRPTVEHVFADDVFVPEEETRNGGAPRQLHRRKSNVLKSVLKAEFPDLAEKIDGSGSQRGADFRRRPAQPTRARDCVEMESWYLPVGVQGRKGYVPGRHVRVIDGVDLVDEEWHEDYFPCARIVWTDRAGMYFGISLAERITGHQRVVNKRHWQIDRQLDQLANPTTYVRPADANLAVRTTNELGTIAVVRGDYPQTVTPSPVSPQVFEHLEIAGEKSFNESGISRMAAQGTKPAGLDSGRAIREYHAHTTIRFAPQEEAFEVAVLHVLWLLAGVCKRLGDAAPKMLWTTRFGPREIEWEDVDLGDFKIQLEASSTLNDSQAGREQQLTEWAQAGVISTDVFRRLVGHPDLEREMSLYTAALEDIDACVEEIGKGRPVMPDPYMNLKMAQWRAQNQQLIWKHRGAPERILELLRQFIVQAVWMDGMQAPAANAMPGDPTAAAGQPPIPQMAGGPPGAATPTAALSPQAMQLVAG